MTPSPLAFAPMVPAGTIGAKANGEGVIGVAPGATIISLKVFDSFGGGASYQSILEAVEYAAQIINDNGLPKDKCVINMSLGGRPGSC